MELKWNPKVNCDSLYYKKVNSSLYYKKVNQLIWETSVKVSMLKLQVKCKDNFIIPKTKTTQNTNNRIFLKCINGLEKSTTKKNQVMIPVFSKNLNCGHQELLVQHTCSVCGLNKKSIFLLSVPVDRISGKMVFFRTLHYQH